MIVNHDNTPQHPKNSLRLINSNGCVLVPAMIVQHQEDARVAQWGVNAIANMAYQTEAAQTSLLQEGAPKAIVRSMEYHRTQEWVVSHCCR